MKNILFLVSLLILLSCGNKTNKTEGEDAESATIEQTDKSGAIGGCDEFLDDYEAWVDEVVKIYANYRENPLDEQNTEKLMQTTQELSEWSEKWVHLYDCASDDKYVKRMEELEERVEKAMIYEE